MDAHPGFQLKGTVTSHFVNVNINVRERQRRESVKVHERGKS